MPQDDSIPVAVGEVIAGKYRIERVLGRGGMGVVVAAMHTELDQRVALKFLLPQAMEHPAVVARFSREAKAAAKIKSEHVARVIDVGALENGAPYVVMEFMEGEDLSVVVTRRGPFSVEVAVGYVLEACEAIAEAHAYGIVHRDIKPANLFLAKQPNGRAIVKVLDFGISKSTLSTTQAQLTQTTQVMGSPYYMSPEQMISAKSVDVRSDIWALGIVLYEFLTARVPFQSDTLPELIAAVLQREHEPLRTVRPDVPPELEAVVHRCLAKEPAVRYANVAELAAALAPFGPARSNVSVERITSVLGLAGPPPPSDAGPTQITGTPATLGQTGSPRAGIVQATPAAGGKAFAFATGATTTAKPLSSDATPLPPGVSGPKGVWVAVAAGAAIVVIGTLGTIGWRLSASRTAATVATPAASSGSAASSSEPPATAPSQTASAAASAPAASDSAASAAATPSAAPSSAAPMSETAAAAPAAPAAPPPRTGGHTTPAEPAAPAVRPPPATDRPHPAPGTNCTVVTDYDSEGQPHFKKVCR